MSERVTPPPFLYLPAYQGDRLRLAYRPPESLTAPVEEFYYEFAGKAARATVTINDQTLWVMPECFVYRYNPTGYYL